MPEPMDHRVEDRRDTDRRIDVLERQHDQLMNLIGEVRTEAKHASEINALRLDVIGKGQDFLAEQVKLLNRNVERTMEDPVNTAMGRALVKDIGLLQVQRREEIGRVEELEKNLNDLTADANQLKGALRFAQQTGLGGLFLALGSLALVILRWAFGH
jgi:hypothetical protein